MVSILTPPPDVGSPILQSFSNGNHVQAAAMFAKSREVTEIDYFISPMADDERLNSRYSFCSRVQPARPAWLIENSPLQGPWRPAPLKSSGSPRVLSLRVERADCLLRRRRNFRGLSKQADGFRHISEVIAGWMEGFPRSALSGSIALRHEFPVL